MKRKEGEMTEERKCYFCGSASRPLRETDHIEDSKRMRVLICSRCMWDQMDETPDRRSHERETEDDE